MAKKKTHKANRSAVSGEFVTETYAKKHKKTTVEETVKNATPKKKRK